MRKLIHIAIIPAMLAGLIAMPGCSNSLASAVTERATIGYMPPSHEDLVSLPKPKDKIAVAVYKFRDQTGQYKTSPSATTFSTAVTQGATPILIKALEDSGWFIPIEREGLPNLLNERQIIRQTRVQHEAKTGEKQPELPALMFAGVIMEGGIVSYDTDIVTGGFGLKYAGVGGFGEFRRDAVSIYLRAVSSQTGMVLKTVSTTKTILSREVDLGLYRFVSVKTLLEIETGLSTNEPPTMCVQEAIEKAVRDMVIEGIQAGFWEPNNPEDVNNSPVIQRYLEEKKGVEMAAMFDEKGRPVKAKGAEKRQKRQQEQQQPAVSSGGAADEGESEQQAASPGATEGPDEERLIRAVQRQEEVTE